MFSLIIAIVSVLLVGILAIASIYYGGSNNVNQTSKVAAATVINQAVQVAGAGDLTSAQGNAWPYPALTFPTDMLVRMPEPPKTAYASGLSPQSTDWEYYIPTSHHFVLRNKINKDACMAINKAVQVTGIPASLMKDKMILCFGPTEPYTFYYDPPGTNIVDTATAITKSTHDSGNPTPGYPRLCPDGTVINTGECVPNITVNPPVIASGTPSIGVSPVSIAFPNTLVGSNSTAQVLLTNTGDANLLITNGQTNGAGLGIANNPCGTISPLASCAVTLSFTPTSAGLVSGGFTFNTNATGSGSLGVFLSGRGLLPVEVVTSLTPSWVGLAGGPVTALGANFDANTTISVDGVLATVNAPTATSVDFTAPAHAAGPVNVQVSTEGSSASATLTYVADLLVDATFTPQTTPINTTPTMTFTGAGFSPGMVAYFVPASGVPEVGTGLLLQNSGHFTVTAPPFSAAGLVSVVVTDTYGRQVASSGLLTVTEAPTLASWSIPAHHTGDAPFTLVPPTSDSTGAFTYVSSNPSVATISGSTVTILGQGTSVITATQAADGYFTTGTTTANLVVSTSSATLGTFTVPSKTVGDPSFTLTPPTSSSPGTFSYTSSNSAIAAVSGSVVTVVAPGTATITANQAASGGYLASSTSASLVVTAVTFSSLDQTWSFLPGRTVSAIGSGFSSGVAVTVGGASVSTSVVDNAHLTFVAPAHPAGSVAVNLVHGTATISAGTLLYVADLTVNATMSPSSVPVNTPTSLALTGSGFSAGMTVTFVPATGPVQMGTAVAASDTAHMTVTAPGFTNAGLVGVIVGDTYGRSILSAGSLQVTQVPTINVWSIPSHNMGDAPFTVIGPTSTSDAAFTYISSNVAVAAVSGTTLTIKGPGSSTITATQPAKGSYSIGTATAVLVVVSAPVATITDTANNPLAGNILNLGNASIGSVAKTAQVKISNTGGSALNVTNISVSGSSQMSVDNACVRTIAAGYACSATVSFLPVVEGADNAGMLTISSSDTAHPTTVLSLTGTGLTARAALSGVSTSTTPPDGSFNAAPGALATKTYYVRNQGGLALALSGTNPVTLVGTSTKYSILNTSTCVGTNVSVASGSSCSVVVQYAPTVVGTEANPMTLSVTHSGLLDPSPLTLALSGTGQGAEIKIKDVGGTILTNVLFPDTLVGTDSPIQDITINNSGNANLVFNATPVSVVAPFVLTSTDCSGTLVPGTSCLAHIKFHPTAQTAYSGNYLTVNSNLSTPPMPMLSGTGTFAVATKLWQGLTTGTLYFVDANQDLWAKNQNGQYQLGDSTTTTAVSYKKIASGVAQVASDSTDTVILKSDGTVWRAGTAITAAKTFTSLGLTNVTAVAAGTNTILALKNDGTLWALGDNSAGQLGAGSTTTISTPLQVASSVAQVSMGGSTSMIVRTDGSLWVTGYNNWGQLGLGSAGASVKTFTAVAGMTSIAQVSVSETFAAVLKTDGSVWTSGYNGLTGPGNSTIYTTSFQSRSFGGVVKLAASKYGLLAVLSDGTLWGYGAYGFAGPIQATSQPFKATGLSNVIDIAGGNQGAAVALTSQGTMYNIGASTLNGTATNTAIVVP